MRKLVNIKAVKTLIYYAKESIDVNSTVVYIFEFVYRVSSFKRRGVYKIPEVSGAAYIGRRRLYLYQRFITYLKGVGKK